MTVFDGKLAAKTEVWVNIVNKSSQGNSGRRPFSPNIQGGRLSPPSFLSLPGFNSQPPLSVANNPPPHPRVPAQQQKIYPENSRPSSPADDTTHLLPVTTPNVSGNHPSIESSEASPTINSIKAGVDAENTRPENGKNDLSPDKPVKSAEPDLKSHLYGIFAVIVAVLGLGSLGAFLLRKHLRKEKDIKNDIVSFSFIFFCKQILS